MLTDEELFLYEYNNNEEFRNSFNEYYSKSNILDSESSSSTIMEVGSTALVLSEQNENSEESETQTIVVYENTDYTEQLNGVLSNTYFIVYFMFAFFVFGALCLVIKFLKSFF